MKRRAIAAAICRFGIAKRFRMGSALYLAPEQLQETLATSGGRSCF